LLVLAPLCRQPVPVWTTGYVTSGNLWDEFAKMDDIPSAWWCWVGLHYCELAQSFTRPAQAMQIEMAPRIMGREDEEVPAPAKAVCRPMVAYRLTGHKALRCEKWGCQNHHRGTRRRDSPRI
jgi:hypothetical protein